MAMLTLADLEQAKVDVDLLHDTVHGGASDTVSTEGGSVKSMANAIATLMAYNPRGAWATSTAYAVKDLVLEAYPAAEEFYFLCCEAHTSGTFATDIGNDIWVPVFTPGEIGATSFSDGEQSKAVTIAAQVDALYTPVTVAGIVLSDDSVLQLATDNQMTTSFDLHLSSPVPTGEGPITVRWMVVR